MAYFFTYFCHLQNNIFQGLFIGQNFVQLSEVDSTNNFLKNKLSKSTPLPEGTVIMADKQTAGRGQKTTQWHSEAGKNITASLLLYPVFLQAGQQFDLSRMISLAISKSLEAILQAKIYIKWPNDLYINDRKLSGILIESTLSGIAIRNSIIGFGINVNQHTFPAGAGNPVSMAQILKKEINLLEVLALVCKEIEAGYLGLRAGKVEPLRMEYDRNLYRLNEHHSFVRNNSKPFEGIIKGTTANGLLLLETETGISTFDFKELRYVI